MNVNSNFPCLTGLFYLSSSLHRRQYYFINDPKTWPEAQKFCRDKYTDLATVSDWSDTMELASLMHASVRYVFMGLYRIWGWSLSDTGDYKEGGLTYSNWGSVPPWQIFCGSIAATGEWFATACSSNFNFFCYNGESSCYNFELVI